MTDIEANYEGLMGMCVPSYEKPVDVSSEHQATAPHQLPLTCELRLNGLR